jgi:nucleoid-associated protein YgaU
MRALTCLLVLGMAAVLAVGCESAKKDEALQIDTPTKSAFPEGSTPALEPMTFPPPPPVTKEPTMVPPTKAKTPEKTVPTKAKTPEKTVTAVGTQRHTVKKGDTLSGLAQKYYNDATMWKKIADANKDKVHDKDKITIGSVLVIPAK